MDTTTIVIFFAVIVLVSITLIVTSQLRERAKLERARKVTALEDSYKRANRLLNEIPGQYLTQDLKLLLILRQEDICRQLMTLKTQLPVAQWASEAQQLKKQVIDGQDQRAPMKIDSPDKSTYVKELLQNLFKMIEAQHKAGRIDNATARKNLKFVLFLVHKTHADFHVFQARDYIRQNELRKAIHAYHLASTELGKSTDNPLAKKAVKSFRTRIKELEAMLVEGEASESVEKQQKLDKEWDNFMHEGDWKKKADYDDG
ncbi:hypothetical protein [Marinobacter caseinilyticus]|uniref:hypothetical protein n=1 Tax=Marinobacter caseinilyticus TaxID=2692195 RepID=UPI00140CE1B2|nr:hypothetical protein [Marinobacter caseinilyticus]